jgi:enoyl-CoA hydratase/carnithine racemase
MAARASLDPGVTAAILVGTGDMFVTGADIKILRELDRRGFLAFLGTIQDAFDEIEAMPLPTLAALNGHAMGGGLEFALACDIRFAADEVRLGLPEVKLGLLPGAGGTQRLLRAVGKGRALDLL